MVDIVISFKYPSRTFCVCSIFLWTLDAQVVIDEPTFPPKGEFRVTRDTTFYQLTVAAVAGKAGPQVFGFKFQSADEGETFYDNLQRFNSQGVPGTVLS